MYVPVACNQITASTIKVIVVAFPGLDRRPLEVDRAAAAKGIATMNASMQFASDFGFKAITKGEVRL